ncbi:MAG: amidohydrolase family protein [Lawsonibacter sp.]|nr:amidohydrolase family protein [Lawsonibacter sp.]
MIFDIHTHTFPEKIAHATLEKLQSMCHTATFSDGSEAGLRASMAKAGIEGSLILPVATSARQVVHVNDASAQINDLGPETGLWSLGCMHPDFDGWREELARVASLGLKGVKLHPIYQGVNLDDPRYLRILDRCGELGLLVLTHAGRDIGFPTRDNCTPEMTLNALKQVGPVQMILAHMGGWREWDRVEALLWDTQVCLDTSFALGRITPTGDGYYGPSDLPLMEVTQFVRMTRKFGAHRILYGSDSPWQDQGVGIRLVQELPLTQEEKDAILGGNAQRLFGFSRA